MDKTIIRIVRIKVLSSSFRSETVVSMLWHYFWMMNNDDDDDDVVAYCCRSSCLSIFYSIPICRIRFQAIIVFLLAIGESHNANQR
jgi:hypothetical protein